MADPARSPWFAAFAALLVATASSTQDIVVDAFRVESLPESEQAAGMASYVAAYRVGMLVSTAGALFIVSGFESVGPRALVGVDVGLCGDGRTGRDRHRHRACRDRARTHPHGDGRMRPRAHSKKAAQAGDPLRAGLWRALSASASRKPHSSLFEFLDRARMPSTALAFVVLFKFTDAFSGTMTAPFVIDIGFPKVDYAGDRERASALPRP